jgi:hypothetical protein
MATAETLRELALALPGTAEAPHFDRVAYRVRRIYVTLAPDRKTANFFFTPEEQEIKCAVYPDAFTPLDNKWGTQGWTRAVLAKLTREELRAALETAHVHAAAKQGRGRL